MAVTNVKVQTGNRIFIRINDKDVGMLQSLRSSDDFGMQETSEIGNINVIEYVPSLARHTVTASVVQLKRESLERLGIASARGQDALKGVVFDIVIMDRDANRMLKTYKSCSYASGDAEVTKHAVVMRNATFLALDVLEGSNWDGTPSI